MRVFEGKPPGCGIYLLEYRITWGLSAPHMHFQQPAKRFEHVLRRREDHQVKLLVARRCGSGHPKSALASKRLVEEGGGVTWRPPCRRGECPHLSAQYSTLLSRTGENRMDQWARFRRSEFPSVSGEFFHPKPNQNMGALYTREGSGEMASVGCSGDRRTIQSALLKILWQKDHATVRRQHVQQPQRQTTVTGCASAYHPLRRRLHGARVRSGLHEVLAGMR